MTVCPVCGHVEATQGAVKSNAMNVYVDETTNKVHGVYNCDEDHFFIDVKNKDGNVVKTLKLVRQDVVPRVNATIPETIVTPESIPNVPVSQKLNPVLPSSTSSVKSPSTPYPQFKK